MGEYAANHGFSRISRISRKGLVYFQSRFPASMADSRLLTAMTQFPSNGKAYPKQYGNSLVSAVAQSFNSLQTGKRIQRKWCPSSLRPRFPYVSIPFKRESVSKGIGMATVVDSGTKFQFPSNGKAYPKLICIRESKGTRLMFQFPSNGKAYPKENTRRI